MSVKIFYHVEFGLNVRMNAACQEVKGVLTPTSHESQDELTSVWSVFQILKNPNFKDHSLVRLKVEGKARHPRNESALLQFN
jgi:hypothetical protein